MDLLLSMRFWENIPVAMWQWVLSQAIGVVGLVLLFTCWQIRNKVKTLSVVTVARILSTITSALLENWILAIFFAISAVRGVIFTWLEVRRAKGREPHKYITFGLLIGSLAAAGIFMGLTVVWWFDWVLFGLSLVFIFAEWFHGIHFMRGAQFALSSAMIVNAWFFANIMGIAKAVAVIGSIIVFYIRADIKRRRALVISENDSKD